MLETRFAGNNTDKNKHYIIANADFSELNWKNTCDIIRNDKSVKLTISNIIFSALSRDYSFLQSDSIEALKLKFISRIPVGTRASLDDFFLHVQKAPNLKVLSISITFSNINQTSTEPRLRGVDFKQIQGSLAHLEKFKIKLFDPSFFCPSNMPAFDVALIDPSKAQGNLKSFQYRSFSYLRSLEDYPKISKILDFNKQTLEQVGFTYSNSQQFQYENHPSNFLGDSFAKMTNLHRISLEISGQANVSNFQELFNGIAIGQQSQSIKSQSQSSISFYFYNIPSFDCSGIGSCLKYFQKVIFSSSLSMQAATEIGKALGDSQNLQSLRITSQSEELGVVLGYCLSSASQLKDLSISYQGQTQEILSKQLSTFKAIQSIERLTLYFIDIETFSLLEHIIKEFRKIGRLTYLEINFRAFNAAASDFKKLLEGISKLSTLESLSIIIYKLSALDEITPEEIYLPLYHLHSLQKICLGLSNPNEHLKKRPLSLQLLSGLIGHPRAHNLSIKSYKYQTIVEVFEKRFKIEFECQMASLIAFNRTISPSLAFHPIRHILDFYL